MIKKVSALFLALVLCVSGSFTALATANGSIEGEIDIENPIYNVVLPLNLDFKLDPIELKGQNQIFSGVPSFNIINKTLAPILVGYDLTISTYSTSGVTFVDDPSTINTTLTPGNEKKIFLGVQSAHEAIITDTIVATSGVLTGNPVDATTSSNEISATYQIPAIFATVGTTEDDLNVLPFQSVDTTTRALNFGFLLDAGEEPSTATPEDETDDLPKSADSVGSFRLFAKLTTYNDSWAKSDLEIAGTYKFFGLKATDYTAFVADDTIMKSTAAHAMMEPLGESTPVDPGNPGGGSTTPSTLTISGVTAPVPGAAPVTTAPTGTEFTSGAIAWTPGDAKFAPLTDYTAKFTLTAKFGYDLSALTNSSITVTGAKSATYNTATKEVSAVFASGNGFVGNYAGTTSGARANLTRAASVNVFKAANAADITKVLFNKTTDVTLASGTHYTTTGGNLNLIATSTLFNNNTGAVTITVTAGGVDYVTYVTVV